VKSSSRSRRELELERTFPGEEDESREHEGLLSLSGVVQRILAAVLLVLLFPLFLLLYLPVRLSANAPFFFRQQRPGFMGRHFSILKITTMRAGSHRVSHYERGVAVDDPNVTWIGKFLRETKLDELPQLWNVVRGDMEFVGPRPIAPGLHRMLSEEIPGFNNRYLVKPGLTNIAQVSVLENALGDDTLADWRLRFEGEEHYIRHKSVSYDLILIVMTVLFVLRKAFGRRGSRGPGSGSPGSGGPGSRSPGSRSSGSGSSGGRPTEAGGHASA